MVAGREPSHNSQPSDTGHRQTLGTCTRTNASVIPKILRHLRQVDAHLEKRIYMSTVLLIVVVVVVVVVVLYRRTI